MTDIYIAFSGSGDCRTTMKLIDWSSFSLGILVSFSAIDAFYRFDKETDGMMRPHRWMLDSGAYSAWSSGQVVDAAALIAEAKKPRWHETVALDVVGDPAKSLENALMMRAAGCRSFPVFHYGEPLEYLDEYVRLWPKVGLSCRFGESITDSLSFLDSCFSRHWPHRYHSFGWVARKAVMRFPFESADTASWFRAARWGIWRSFGGSMSVRTPGGLDLRAEIDSYSLLQAELKWRWKSTLSKIRTTETA